MASSRTKYVAKNISAGLLCQLVNAILGFIVRYYFIYTLGIEYLGVNGLFTNILQFLSLVELGVGSAISYRLYAPLKNDETEHLKSWMSIYKKAYNLLGGIVMLLGLILTPLMPWLIKDAPEIHESLYVIFFLFVLNSAISYFFIYKQSLIIADQKNYVVSIIHQLGKIIQSILQIVILITTHNFILFLIIGVIMTFLINLSISREVERRYPFLKDKNCRQLPREQIKLLFSDVKSLILFKIGYVILNNANNIIISVCLGIAFVGLGSNYFLIMGALEIVTIQFLNGFTASVGNYNVDKSPAEKKRLFYQLNFLLLSICGFMFSGVFIFANDFINLWLGSDEYNLTTFSVLAIVLCVFFKNTGAVCYMFRTTQGAFKEARFVPLFTSIVHIFLALVLVEYWGFAGVFISSSFAMLTIDLYDGYIVSKLNGFSYPSFIASWLLMYGLILISSTVSIKLIELCISSTLTWPNLTVQILIYAILYWAIYISSSWILIPNSKKVIKRVLRLNIN